MYKQILALTVAALAAAQVPDLSGLPQCAQGIVLSQITATSCGTDIACVCRDSTFIGNLRNLIVAQCGEADASAADAFHRSTCAANGVTIDAAPTPAPTAGQTTPAGDAGATVTSTTIVPSDTLLPPGNSSTSSVTGNPSVTATTLPSTLGRGATCSVTTTTVCHTATVAPSATRQTPSNYTGAASVFRLSNVLAALAVAAAVL